MGSNQGLVIHKKDNKPLWQVTLLIYNVGILYINSFLKFYHIKYLKKYKYLVIYIQLYLYNKYENTIIN